MPEASSRAASAPAKVGQIDHDIAVDVAEDRGHGADVAEDLVTDQDHVLAADHPVIVHVARQHVKPAREAGDELVADGDRDPVGRVDRLSQGNGVARSRAGDRDRPVVVPLGLVTVTSSGGECRGLGEVDLHLLDAQPGHVRVPARRQQS